MAGTIFVDTDHLPGVTNTISQIQQEIENNKNTINGLSQLLNTYLTGSAPVIKTVEDSFSATMTSLITVDTALTALVTQLTNVQNDALAAIGAL